MKRLTTQQFLRNFNERYPDHLGLDMSLFEYTTALTPSSVVCKIHNLKYLAKPDTLYSGSKGCLTCKKDALNKLNTMTQEEFIIRSKSKHGDYYDYSKVNYVNSSTKVILGCPKHGDFKKNPQGHYLAGSGCPKCGYNKLKTPQQDWINKATAIHKAQYDYSQVDYINNYTPVAVICKTHGAFNIMPKVHTLDQRGCPECYRGNKSYKEIAWLDNLGIPKSHRQVRIRLNGKRYMVDAKVDNVIYEFWGDFWHGNPSLYDQDKVNTVCGKTFGQLYNETQLKRQAIIQAGYDLVEIWESQWAIDSDL